MSRWDCVRCGREFQDDDDGGIYCPACLAPEALRFAGKAHDGQVRKYDGGPYIQHPIRVAERLRALGASEEAVAAAYLHDVVEDCGVEIAVIYRLFGFEVGCLVTELTDIYTKTAYPDLNRAARKKLEVERQAKMSMRARIIKLADVLDNLASIDPRDPFALVFLAEKTELLTAIGGSTTPAQAELTHRVERAAAELKAKIDALHDETYCACGREKSAAHHPSCYFCLARAEMAVKIRRDAVALARDATWRPISDPPKGSTGYVGGHQQATFVVLGVEPLTARGFADGAVTFLAAPFQVQHLTRDEATTIFEIAAAAAKEKTS